jgi:hypothetical protein
MVPLILTIAASYPKKKFNSAAKVKEAEKIFIETARGIFEPISGGKWSIDEKGGWTPTGGELEIEDCMTFQSSVKPSELLKEENLKKIRSLIWEYCAQLQHQCVYFSIHPNYPCDNIDPLGQFEEENPEKESIEWRERDIQRRGFMTPVTKEEFAYIPFKDLEL